MLRNSVRGPSLRYCTVTHRKQLASASVYRVTMSTKRQYRQAGLHCIYQPIYHSRLASCFSERTAQNLAQLPLIISRHRNETNATLPPPVGKRSTPIVRPISCLFVCLSVGVHEHIVSGTETTCPNLLELRWYIGLHCKDCITRWNTVSPSA